LNFDEDQYNQRISDYSLYLNKLNEILDVYNSMNLPSINSKEFMELIRNTDSLFYDKMSDNSPVVIGGFTLNKTKAFEMFNKPPGYEAIVKLIENYKKIQGWNGNLQHINIEENKVVISNKVLETEKEAATVYATNEEQLKAYKYAEKIIKLTEETFGKPQQDIAAKVNELITFDKFYNAPGGEYRINFKNLRGVGVVV
ncbi:MAG: hypothetical protein WKF85_13790, partial [Chitinophagaceae bacterium]